MSDLTSYLYLIASLFFILSLRGLSSPASARWGNVYGIVGMTIAVFTTVFSQKVLSYELIIAGLVVGGLIGTFIARSIAMTALPQLVAAFHSLVGLAAVMVAAAAYYNPGSFDIGSQGHVHMSALVEMGLGTAIGAITFTGSIVAFLKLQGILSGKPLRFSGQHMLNLFILVSIFALLALFTVYQTESAFWMIVALSFCLGLC